MIGKHQIITLHFILYVYINTYIYAIGQKWNISKIENPYIGYQTS